MVELKKLLNITERHYCVFILKLSKVVENMNSLVGYGLSSESEDEGDNAVNDVGDE